ncbi:MAG: hypothetical protein U0132_03040 [Gemmatimonadaceae bacterium]
MLTLEYLVAHGAILALWTITIAALLGLGRLYQGLFFRQLATLPPFYTFWTGYALTLLLLQLWHFVRPIDGLTLAAALALGGAGLLTSRAWVRAELTLIRATRPTWVHAIGAVMVLWMANMALGPVSNFDGGAYHIPTIVWTNAHRIIPGLGNLHGRLAFNSSSLLVGALLNVGPLHGRTYHVVAGVLLIPVLLHALGAIRRLVQPNPTAVAADAYAATMFLLMLFATLAHEPSSLDTDLPVGLVLLACGELLIRTAHDGGDGEANSHWRLAILAMLTAASVTLKLSAAVIGFSIALVTAWTFRRLIGSAWRRLLPSLLVPVLLVISWMARGVVLSGYPLYPSTLLAMPVPWRVPLEQTLSEADWVTFSARMLLQHDIPVDGNWFRFWVKGLGMNPQDGVMLLLPILLTIIAGLMWWRARGSSLTASPRVIAPWTLYVAPAVGLAFWFAVAPHPRFAVGSLWIVACTTMGLAYGARALDDAERARRAGKIARNFTVVFGTLVLVQAIFAPAKMYERIAWIGRSTMLGGLATRPGPDHGMHPMGSSRLLRYTTNSGLKVVVPTSNNLCWDAPFCTPHPSPYLKLRTSGRVVDGFVADSDRWEPVRWPDPLTPFFPYWRCLRQPHAAGTDAVRECALYALKVPTDTLKQVILLQGGDTLGIGPGNRARRANEDR